MDYHSNFRFGKRGRANRVLLPKLHLWEVKLGTQIFLLLEVLPLVYTRFIILTSKCNMPSTSSVHGHLKMMWAITLKHKPATNTYPE